MSETDKYLQRIAKQLARKECANYYDGFCIIEDQPCHVIDKRHPTIHEGAIGCDWFSSSVLPHFKELEQAFLAEINRESRNVSADMKNCIRCGEPFIPASNRQKYCTVCQHFAELARGREKQRRYANKQKLMRETDRFGTLESL